MATQNHRDIDRGWAWVVLGAAMMAQIITGIVAVSVGVFQAEFMSHFSGSNSYISLIASIYMSLQLTMGPIAGLLCNVFGIRAAMMIGAVLMSVGLFLSSFATSLHYLLGLYSIVAGCGFGITYTPNNVVLGHYFHKRRGIANGLAVAAVGIGVGPGTSLMVWIIDNHGWRFALSVLASIALQKAILGSLYFPLEKHSTRSVCCGRRTGKAEIEKSEKQKLHWLWFLGHPHWWILCLSYGVSMVGFGIHLAHFPSYALACGVSNTELSQLITVFGIVLSLSRTLGGFFCNDSSVDLLTVMFATQGLYGVFMIFMPLYARTYSGLMVYQVMVSLFYGTSMVPITPFVAQLFGVDKLATVFGWIMMWGGLGYLTGPVVAGVLYDLSSSYAFGFYIGGSAIVLSALLLLLITLTKLKVIDTAVPNQLQRLVHEDVTICVDKATDDLKEKFVATELIKS